jgi:hypothetical protein
MFNPLTVTINRSSPKRVLAQAVENSKEKRKEADTLKKGEALKRRKAADTRREVGTNFFRRNFVGQIGLFAEIHHLLAE